MPATVWQILKATGNGSYMNLQKLLWKNSWNHLGRTWRIFDIWNLDFDGLKKSEQKQKKTIYLHTVAPLDFRTFLRADSKKEAKFTTDKSSKDQLSEGKAVRDLLFGPSTMVWGDSNREEGSQEENFSWYFLTRKEISVVEIPTPLMTRCFNLQSGSLVIFWIRLLEKRNFK